jgi:hypothetical protein
MQGQKLLYRSPKCFCRKTEAQYRPCPACYENRKRRADRIEAIFEQALKPFCITMGSYEFCGYECKRHFSSDVDHGGWEWVSVGLLTANWKLSIGLPGHHYVYKGHGAASLVKRLKEIKKAEVQTVVIYREHRKRI